MKSLFVNTVLGAGLAAALAVVGLGVVSEHVFAPHYPEQPAFPVDLTPPAPAGGGGEGAAAAPEVDLATMMANASIEAGQKLTAQCKACHVFDQGGANGVGPFLWNVYGRTAGTVPGFSYSPAMAGLGQQWTAETLNAFLAAPKEYVAGTLMSYAGLKKAEDRANLITYLHSLNPAAPPLPAVTEAVTEAAPEAVASTPEAEATPPAPATAQSPAGAQP
ncbi:MAG: cytochrome c family protein [Hyphomonadaceae bacterium]|nr:cytochrome c family protein [Hyphomonadaceae bacterium]